MINNQNYGLLVGLVILVGLTSPALAFGAGNIASISKVEGQNWRHGDIEDALLTLSFAASMGGKKFNKINVSRTYFGNWLRDYSQAIDVGTVKTVSSEAIRLLLCVLGFMTFGYGSGEFEVTAERLGCYRPEEHIDNPKDYAENEDARQYHRALRGPIDEQRELSVDPETGMKNYIANDRADIMTSSKLVRKLFTEFIEKGRQYGRSNNKADKYEALRVLGTGLHCLEDFFAHSNYCELALIELGERDVFPHVGRNTRIQLEGARDSVYPIVTGTFGGVDFLHSVTGEVSDKLTQNEIDELEGTLEQGSKSDTSMLRELLDKIPDGIFGDKHQSDKIDQLQQNAANSQMQNMSVSPREPEEFTNYIREVFQQIMPAIEFHDDIMKGISSATEKIPVLPKIIEQLEEQLSVFIFSLIAPFIVPLIGQIKNELKTGSDEIIQSSEREQHIVFNNDNSSDPTHSMLSKDHFSNILNEIAGRCAASTVTWVVPQLMEAVDDERADVNGILDSIVNGIMHHPAQRDMGRGKAREGRQRMFENVKDWWGEVQQDEYRRKLTREGVQNGENHKEGVHDTGHGHGCVGKLKMAKLYGGGPETLEDKIAGAAANAIFQGASGAISGIVEQNTGYKMSQPQRKEESSGGLGGLLEGMAGSLLGGFGGGDTKRESESRRNDDGSYTRTEKEYGQQGGRYGQAEYSETKRPDGSQQSEYRRYEQQEQGQSYGYQQRTETHSTSYGYEQRTERVEQHSSGGDYGRHRKDNDSDEDKKYRRRKDDDDDDEDKKYRRRKDDDSDDDKKHHRRRKSNDSNEDSSYGKTSHGGGGGYGGRQESSYGGRQESSYGGQQGGYGGRQESSYGGGQESSYGGQQGGYGGRQESSYGGQQGGYGGRQESSYGGQQQGGYGGRQESSYGGQQQGGYGGRQESSYGGQQGGYGGGQEGGYGGGNSSGYGRRDEGGYGGGAADEYTRQSQGGGNQYGRRDEEERRW